MCSQNYLFFNTLTLYLFFFFQSLTSGYVQGTFEMANKEENREKNRYPNILPCKPVTFLLHQTINFGTEQAAGSAHVLKILK